MAEPGQQSFEVVPTRIGGTGGGGRPGRRRRLPLALVIGIAVAIPAIAWIGPRMESRPEVDLSFLRPTPTAGPLTTPRALFPSPAAATPLPAVTIAEGEHPTDPIPIDIGGLRLVDPATGEFGPAMELRLDSDAVFASADGNGWWCVCFNRVQGSVSEKISVEIRRVNGSGQTTARHAVGEYLSTATPPASDFYTRLDLEIASDGRTGYLASAARSGNDWAMALDTINLETGVVSGRVDLGSLSVEPLPGPTPPPDQGSNESYLSGPQVRLSPDGRRLLVWAWVDAYSWTGEQGPSTPRVWTIDLDQRGGGLATGGLLPFSEAAADRLRQCGWVAWTTPDEIAAVCWPRSDQTTQALDAVILRSDGSEVRRSQIQWAMDSWFADPILDLANRDVYLWQPGAHLLQRLDLDTGRTDRLEVDPKATAGGPGGPGGSGAAPGGGTSRKPPNWATFGSDLRLYNTPQMIPEPGGSGRFALGTIQGDRGYGGREFASTGVWVFDAREFALLDRWAAATLYGSLGLSDDGRWLMAAGQPGFDADGNQASWGYSLTIHDTVDGRPAVQLGSLGADSQIFLMPR